MPSRCLAKQRFCDALPMIGKIGRREVASVVVEACEDDARL
jgi:hypothetical protein